MEENKNLEMLHEDIENIRPIRPGELIKGKVIKKGEEGYFVNINYKAEGILPFKEKLTDGEGEILNDTEEGEEIWVVVNRFDDQGYVWLSREKARYRGAWIDIEESMNSGKPLIAKVLKKVKGGLTVNIGVNAFLPASCVDKVPQNLDEYLDKTLTVKVIEADRRTRNVVVSHKVILEEEDLKKKQETIATLEIGQIRKGIVKNITSFGAFIDLGGIDGLLHISEISWGRIGKLEDIFNKGDEIDIRVIGWDPVKEEISLSMKRLKPDPWENIEEKIKVGDVVQGKVISIKDFGVFVETEEGVEGLVHISDISWGYVKHPQEAVKIGDMVDARILDIDKEKKRLSLGLKQIHPDPWLSVGENYPVDSVARVRVERINPKGAIVEIEDGVEGKIPIEELSWKRVNRVSEILRRNQLIDARIVDVDPENRQITLSLKQMKENPWEQAQNLWKVGDTVDGNVQRLMNFGAFIELIPDVEALLPLSELDWEPVKHPGQLLKKSQTLPVKIIEFQPEEQRIVVSRKAILPDPWFEIKNKYPVGSIHTGKVVRIVDFGAFIELEKGWDGLVHISEISDKRISSPSEVIEENQEVNVKIIKLDDQERKIGLSIKQTLPRDEEKERTKEREKPKKEQPITQTNGRTTLGDVFGDTFNNLLNNMKNNS
ncbi:MAG: S1 RNA-binding domain-containing protein [Atribacterota bacterium]|uniref:S1 RNA-binding domain-containing protein n=1 Tax=Atribacter sp. TaxID=2847780 RepID=UPI003D9511CC|nr:S1 RNA-binding domain-containing protein [Atribacterota bacterium]